MTLNERLELVKKYCGKQWYKDWVAQLSLELIGDWHEYLEKYGSPDDNELAVRAPWGTSWTIDGIDYFLLGYAELQPKFSGEMVPAFIVSPIDPFESYQHAKQAAIILPAAPLLKENPDDAYATGLRSQFDAFTPEQALCLPRPPITPRAKGARTKGPGGYRPDSPPAPGTAWAVRRGGRDKPDHPKDAQGPGQPGDAGPTSEGHPGSTDAPTG